MSQNISDENLLLIDSSIDEALEIIKTKIHEDGAFVTGWHDAAVNIYCAKLIADTILKAGNKND